MEDMVRLGATAQRSGDGADKGDVFAAVGRRVYPRPPQVFEQLRSPYELLFLRPREFDDGAASSIEITS